MKFLRPGTIVSAAIFSMSFANTLQAAQTPNPVLPARICPDPDYYWYYTQFPVDCMEDEAMTSTCFDIKRTYSGPNCLPQEQIIERFDCCYDDRRRAIIRSKSFMPPLVFPEELS